MAHQSELSAIRVFFEPAIRRFFHAYWRLDARVDDRRARPGRPTNQGRIFLVKHSYVAGWQHAGRRRRGRRDARCRARPANCSKRAISRLDSAAAICSQSLAIAGSTQHQHVALYVVRSFHQVAPPQPNHEIIAHGFFAPDALAAWARPRATRRRLAEVWPESTVFRNLVKPRRDITFLSSRPFISSIQRAASFGHQQMPCQQPIMQQAPSSERCQI